MTLGNYKKRIIDNYPEAEINIFSCIIERVNRRRNKSNYLIKELKNKLGSNPSFKQNEVDLLSSYVQHEHDAPMEFMSRSVPSILYLFSKSVWIWYNIYAKCK